MDIKTLLAVAETYRAMVNPPVTETISEATQRPKWMPESISNEDVSHFMGAVAKAHSAGQKHFEFGGKKYKVTIGSDAAKKIAGNMNEALDPKADAGVWIKDFVKSDAPQFSGKSKEDRIQMALGAWYNARREAGLEEEVDSMEIKHDNVLDKRDDQDEMEPAPVAEEKDEMKGEDDGEKETSAKTDDAKKNPTGVDAEVGDEEVKDVKESATEKAVEGPKKDEQEKLEPRAPGEKKFYDAHKDNVELKDGNPFDSQDGTDKIVAAEKPAPSNTSASAPKPDVEAPVELPANVVDVKRATPPKTKA